MAKRSVPLCWAAFSALNVPGSSPASTARATAPTSRSRRPARRKGSRPPHTSRGLPAWEAVGQGSGGPTDPRQEPIGVLIAGSDDGRGCWQGSAPEGSRAPTMRQAGCGSATDFMQLLQDQAVAVKREEARPGGACRLRTRRGGLPLRLCLPCGRMLDEPLGGTRHAHAGDRYRDRLPGLHCRLRRNGADRDLLAQRLEVEARPAEILRRRETACHPTGGRRRPKQPEAVEPSAAGRVWLRSGSIQRCGSTAC
jgi:hypothetical protein